MPPLSHRRIMFVLAVSSMACLGRAFANDITLEDDVLLNSALPSASAISTPKMSNEGMILAPNNGGSAIQPQTAPTDEDDVVLNAPVRRRDGRPVRIVPWLQAEVGVSDNINQAPKKYAKKGSYQTVNVGLTADYAQPRLDANATVGVTGTHYSGGRGIDVQPFGSVAASAMLVRSHAFVDAGGDYSRSLRIDDKNGYANLRDNNDGVGRVYISPYVQHALGRNTLFELRYAHEHLLSDAKDFDTQYTDGVSAILAHGSLNTRWSAEVQASYDRTNTEGKFGDYSVATGMITGRYGLSRSLSVLGRTGYDKVTAKDYPDGSSAIAEAGLLWTPTPRTSASFLAGWRFNDWSLEANARYVAARSLVLGAGVSQYISSGNKSTFNDPRLAGSNRFGSTINDNAREGNNRGILALRDGVFSSDEQSQMNPANNAIRNRYYTANTKKGTYRGTMATLYATGALNKDSEYLLQGTAEYQKYLRSSDNLYTAYAGLLHRWTPSITSTADVMVQSAGNNRLNEQQYIGMAGIGAGYALARNTEVTLRLTRTQNFGGSAPYKFVEHAAVLGINASF